MTEAVTSPRGQFATMLSGAMDRLKHQHQGTKQAAWNFLRTRTETAGPKG
jgi:hypothetical protein